MDDIEDYCSRNVGGNIMRELKDLWRAQGMPLADFGVGLAINAAILMIREKVPQSVWDEIWELAAQTEPKQS